MMSSEQQLQDLYRNTVLEHSRHPRNFRRLEPADRTVQGHNPLCGDKITVYLRLDDDDITDVAFEGTGCAIAMTSASIMTEIIEGQSVQAANEEVDRVMSQFRGPAAGGPDSTEDFSTMGEMAALGGVRAYPSRIKCATLAWKTLEAALHGEAVPVTTELNGGENVRARQ
ncbi:MAG: SUF system NifU family Fe-S cluster assembly protein [Gammaproteobacteria bacterium]|jgi:nitrogen fixation NifU-like protein|nr:SUF system NifU family Fe-S cluster assembly protein [Gammaproteobacteria bacterium]